MKNFSNFFVLTFVTVVLAPSCQGGFNMTEYFKMPVLNDMDLYDICKESTDYEAIYCGARSFIKPDPSNEVWKIIEKYNKDTKRNFRHDFLRRGICIPWCQKKIKDLDEETKRTLLIEEFDPKYPYELRSDLFYKYDYYEKMFNETVNLCVNLDLYQNYGLKAHSVVLYCNEKDVEYPIDALDIAFVVVFLLILFLVGTASYYDGTLNKEDNAIYYKRPIDEDMPMKKKLLLAFSIQRNYYRLTSIPKDEPQRSLRYVQGFRFLTMTVIVHGHVMLGTGLGPLINTEWVEESFHNVLSYAAFAAPTYVQTFFSIGGMLLAYQFMDFAHNKKFNIHYYWATILGRYIRLTPVYAFVLFFDATWLSRSQGGPFWKRVGETERNYCRTNWWTNLLYVNNYINVEDGCLPQSWYLAADFQLFCFGLLIMMVIWRFPKITKPLIGASLVISYIIPGIVTYINHFDGVYVITPEDRKFMNHSKQFKRLYIAFETNFGNYLTGMVGGLICYNIKKNGNYISQRARFIVRWVVYLIVPVNLVIMLLSYFFYTYDFPKPSIWMSIYAIMYGKYWTVFGAFAAVAFTFQIEDFFVHFLQLRILQPLGRLTYGVYVVHFSLMRILGGESRVLGYINGFATYTASTVVFFIALIFALFLCLCLEFPVTAVFKELLKRDKVKRDENRNVEMQVSSYKKVDPGD